MPSDQAGDPTSEPSPEESVDVDETEAVAIEDSAIDDKSTEVDDYAAMRAENEELRKQLAAQQNTTTETRSSGQHTWRKILAGVLAALAIITLVAGFILDGELACGGRRDQHPLGLGLVGEGDGDGEHTGVERCVGTAAVERGRERQLGAERAVAPSLHGEVGALGDRSVERQGQDPVLDGQLDRVGVDAGQVGHDLEVVVVAADASYEICVALNTR